MPIEEHVLANCPPTEAEAIAYLRQQGLSMMQTMWVLRQKLDMRLADAKSAVSLSPVWADRQGADDWMPDEAREGGLMPRGAH